MILAHDRPNHLMRLISALDDDESHAFIHIDAKSKHDLFVALSRSGLATFINARVPVYWGEYSIVQATLNLMSHALSNAHARYDRFVLLSGSDYPIRSGKYIADFFAAHQDKIFMNCVMMPNDKFGKPLRRLINYYPYTKPGIFGGLLSKLYMLSHGRRRRNYQKILGRLVPYGGSQWWAMPRSAVEYVLRFCEENKAIVKFFENTFCPDEMFFQTIICNSHFSASVQGNLTYAHWTAQATGPSTITSAHMEYLLSRRPLIDESPIIGRREILFARKFPDDSEELTMRLDAQMANDRYSGD